MHRVQLLANAQLAAGHVHLVLHAPMIARKARPGQSLRLQAHPRKLFWCQLLIVNSEADSGMVEVLYRPEDEASQMLAQRQAGDFLHAQGPLGSSLLAHMQRKWVMLLADSHGLAVMTYFAERLYRLGGEYRPLLILEADLPLPFETCHSATTLGLGGEGRLALALLESQGIDSSVADSSASGRAQRWLAMRSPEQLAQVELFVCARGCLLSRTRALAQGYKLPLQSLPVPAQLQTVIPHRDNTVQVYSAQHPGR